MKLNKHTNKQFIQRQNQYMNHGALLPQSPYKACSLTVSFARCVYYMWHHHLEFTIIYYFNISAANRILCRVRNSLLTIEWNCKTAFRISLLLFILLTVPFRLVVWHSGRTSVFAGELSVPYSICCSLMTTYLGKSPAIGQPTRPTQPFIPSGSINK